MSFRSFILGVVTLAICTVSVESAMECKLFNFGEDKSVVGTFFEKIINQCPAFPGSEKEYCCYDFERKAHCCDSSEFFVNVGIMLMIVIVFLMLVSSIVSFVCCICCPCCCWYKRRRGRVCQNQQTVSIHTAPRTQTEYQPIVKPHSHLPPGAYPVFPPQSSEMKYSRSQS